MGDRTPRESPRACSTEETATWNFCPSVPKRNQGGKVRGGGKRRIKRQKVSAGTKISPTCTPVHSQIGGETQGAIHLEEGREDQGEEERHPRYCIALKGIGRLNEAYEFNISRKANEDNQSSNSGSGWVRQQVIRGTNPLLESNQKKRRRISRSGLFTL